MNVKALIMNKQIMLALGMIVFIGSVLIAGTGAFFSSQAEATGNVFTAGTLILKIAKDSNNTPVNGWLAVQDAAWNFTALTPGGTPETSAVWLKNEGSVDGMTLGVALDGASATEPNTAKQMRITEMTLDGESLLEGGAGHNFALYEAPTGCDIEVRFGNNDFDTISEAVNAAVANDVICVAPGNYTNAWETSNGGTGFPIVVNDAGVEIVSTEGADTTTIGGGIVLAADNTALKGFTVNGSSLNGGYETGVYVNSADSVEIAFNEFDGATAAGDSRAIYTTSGHSVVGLSVTNNHIHDWNRGIWLNPTTNTTVEYNTIEGVGNGINNDHPINSIVRYNKFADHAGAAFAADVDAGDTVIFRFNEVADDTQGAGISQYGTGNIPAQNNWWGDFDPSDQVNKNAGSVDHTPFAGGPIAGLVNGNDANGNGYADLQDLNTDPILNAGVGLDAGEQKKFVMSIQLDGPTTGNEFQGDSLTTGIVFTLNQI